MANIRLGCHLMILALCLQWTIVDGGKGWRGWRSKDIELFDLVERLSQDFYTMLSVEKTASVSEIKRAYRKLSIQYHPDRNKDENATQVFQDLSLVVEILTDREKRKSYDRILEDGLPDWKEPVYYLRRARKMSFIEFIIFMIFITTISHWIYLWSDYFGKRFNQYMAQPTQKNLERKAKQKAKHRLAEANYYEVFQSPKLDDSLPYRVYYFSKWLYESWPEHREYIVATIQSFRNKEKLEEDEDIQVDRRRRKKQRIENKSEKFNHSNSNSNSKRLTATVADNVKPEKAPQSNVASSTPAVVKKSPIVNKEWTDNDIVTLSKLMKKYPGGTRHRWETIGEEMNRPSSQVATMAQKMKSSLGKIKSPTVTDKIPNANTPSENDKKEEAEIANITQMGNSEEKISQWSPLQSDQLEEALKEYPEEIEDRWDLISMLVPQKTKEECMSRYLEIGENLKKRHVNNNSNDEDAD